MTVTTTPQDEPQVYELTKRDTVELALAGVRAEDLIREHLGRELVGDLSDLDTLQALLDLRVVRGVYELRCLGTTFGVILTKTIEGVHWVVVEDGLGSAFALTSKQSSLLIFPQDMIARRVLQEGTIDVRQTYDLAFNEIVSAHLGEARPAGGDGRPD